MKNCLIKIIPVIGEFLQNKLHLALRPDKIYIKRLKSGMDFLGWVNFFGYRILRTKTKKRMFERIRGKSNLKALNSYMGLLSHGKAEGLKANILKAFARIDYENF